MSYIFVAIVDYIGYGIYVIWVKTHFEMKTKNNITSARRYRITVLKYLSSWNRENAMTFFIILCHFHVGSICFSFFWIVYFFFFRHFSPFWPALHRLPFVFLLLPHLKSLLNVNRYFYLYLWHSLCQVNFRTYNYHGVNLTPWFYTYDAISSCVDITPIFHSWSAFPS